MGIRVGGVRLVRAGAYVNESSGFAAGAHESADARRRATGLTRVLKEVGREGSAAGALWGWLGRRSNDGVRREGSRWSEAGFGESRHFRNVVVRDGQLIRIEIAGLFDIEFVVGQFVLAAGNTLELRRIARFFWWLRVLRHAAVVGHAVEGPLDGLTAAEVYA